MCDDPPTRYDPLEALLPHGHEFRFVDRVIKFEAGKKLEAELNLRREERYFAGHFPGKPLMPGVLIAEALAQSGGLLLGLTHRADRTKAGVPPPHFHLAAVQMKFSRPVEPGVRLRLLAELERDFGGLFRCKVEARVAQEIVASGSITLATAT